jgi:hypothetical protein
VNNNNPHPQAGHMSWFGKRKGINERKRSIHNFNSINDDDDDGMMMTNQGLYHE